MGPRDLITFHPACASFLPLRAKQTRPFPLPPAPQKPVEVPPKLSLANVALCGLVSPLSLIIIIQQGHLQGMGLRLSSKVDLGWRGLMAGQTTQVGLTITQGILVSSDAGTRDKNVMILEVLKVSAEPLLPLPQGCFKSSSFPSLQLGVRTHGSLEWGLGSDPELR